MNVRRAALTLALVAVISFALVALVSVGRDELSGSAGSSGASRDLLALVPLREGRGRGKHRHGQVEERYLTVECEAEPPTSTTTVPPTSTTTVVTTVPTTTATVTGTLTSTVTTTVNVTSTTTATFTLPPTTVPVNLTCANITCNTTDPCNPWVCIVDPVVGPRCVQKPVICVDGNSCTDDVCRNGTCVYVFHPERPGCSCNTTNCTAFGNPCNPFYCQDTNIGANCLPLPPVNCSDGNNCTTDTCVVTNATSLNGTNYVCNHVFNSSLPGCAGLSGGQIVGIVLGAVAVAGMALTAAAWARTGGTVGAGTANAAQTPLAQTSPLYTDPGTAGVMPQIN